MAQKTKFDVLHSIGAKVLNKFRQFSEFIEKALKNAICIKSLSMY
jgi:hypothetical protein